MYYYIQISDIICICIMYIQISDIGIICIMYILVSDIMYYVYSDYVYTLVLGFIIYLFVFGEWVLMGGYINCVHRNT